MGHSLLSLVGSDCDEVLEGGGEEGVDGRATDRIVAQSIDGSAHCKLDYQKHQQEANQENQKQQRKD